MSEEVETIPYPRDVTFGILSQTVIADRIHPKLANLGYVTSDKSLVFTETAPASVHGAEYLQPITLSKIENGTGDVVFDERDDLLRGSNARAFQGKGQIILCSSFTRHQNDFLIESWTPSVTADLVFWLTTECGLRTFVRRYRNHSIER
jgi:hypothetical protein